MMWIRYKVIPRAGVVTKAEKSEMIINFSEVGTMKFVGNRIIIDDEWVNSEAADYDESNLIVFPDKQRGIDAWDFFCRALNDGKNFFDFVNLQGGLDE